MDLGVLESQTGGDYFLDKIFVNQCSDYAAPLVPGRLEHLLHLPTGSAGVCGAPRSSARPSGSSARPAEAPPDPRKLRHGARPAEPSEGLTDPPTVIVFPERVMVCTLPGALGPPRGAGPRSALMSPRGER